MHSDKSERLLLDMTGWNNVKESPRTSNSKVIPAFLSTSNWRDNASVGTSIGGLPPGPEVVLSLPAKCIGPSVLEEQRNADLIDRTCAGGHEGLQIRLDTYVRC